MAKNLSEENFIQYLKDNGMISSQKACSCGKEMSIRPSQRAIDGMVWRCHKCKNAVSIRTNTFMEKSKLSVYKIFNLIFDFIFEMPVTSSMSANNVSKVTAIQWYEYCREICSQKLLKDRKKMGGPNHVVEVDESLMLRRKDKAGRVVHSYWVVGFYDNTQKKGYLQYVEDRKAETLEALIIDNVEPGSIVFTDQWASYQTLEGLGYIHGTENLAQKSVDTESGVCKNQVEAYWNRIKRRLKYKFTSSGDMRWSHVSEAMYRDLYNMTYDRAWESYKTFLKHVAEIYPQ